MPAGMTYEQWFVSEFGPRPTGRRPNEINARIIELRVELAELEREKEDNARWDARYLAGRRAVDNFAPAVE